VIARALAVTNISLSVSGCLKAIRRALAAAAVNYNLKRDPLSLNQLAHSRAFDRADMNEDVVSARLRLNEAKTLLRVEPLYGTSLHDMSFQEQCFGAARCCAFNRCSGEEVVSESVAPDARAESFNRNTISHT